MSAAWLAPLGAAVFIGAAAGNLGSLMLSRRMALTAGPLGHLALPGMALAYLYGVDVSLGALPFVVGGVLLIWALEMRTRLPMEALTGLIFATGVAVAFLLLPLDEAEATLVGDVSSTRALDAVISIVVATGLIVAVKVVYPKLALINVSEEVAIAEGVDVRRYNLLYLLLIAVVVALGVRIVGGLLTAALVAIPPSAARNFSRNVTQYVWGSTAIGALSGFAGIVLARMTDLPAGPLVVLVSAVLFLATLLWKR